MRDVVRSAFVPFTACQCPEGTYVIWDGRSDLPMREYLPARAHWSALGALPRLSPSAECGVYAPLGRKGQGAARSGALRVPPSKDDGVAPSESRLQVPGRPGAQARVEAPLQVWTHGRGVRPLAGRAGRHLRNLLSRLPKRPSPRSGPLPPHGQDSRAALQGLQHGYRFPRGLDRAPRPCQGLPGSIRGRS